MSSVPGEITVLLNQWKQGTTGAFDQLVPLVYPHLRELAGAYLRRERAPDLMQATVDRDLKSAHGWLFRYMDGASTSRAP